MKTHLQNAYGNYSFSSINGFAAGTPSSFTYQYSLPGRTPTVTWGYTTNSIFIQDRWVVAAPRFHRRTAIGSSFNESNPNTIRSSSKPFTAATTTLSMVQ
ncbi:MAG: hypothetical protein QM760_20060 [Nibricoccus sp.]